MTIDDLKEVLFSHEMKDQIRTIVREEVESQIRIIVREEIEAESERRTNDIVYKVNMLRIELTNKLSEIEDRLKNLEIDSKKVHRELSSIHTDINMIIKSLNRDDLKTVKRVEKIEKQLGIIPMI